MPPSARRAGQRPEEILEPIEKEGKNSSMKLRGRIKHSTTVKGLDFKEGTEVHEFHQKIVHLMGALAKHFGRKIAPT
jgi:hypothetical protein